MSDTSRVTRIAILFVIGMVVAAGAAGSASATISGTDTEITDTSFQSDIQSQDTLSDVEDNSSAHHEFTVQTTNDTSSPEVDLRSNKTDHVFKTNASMVEVAADKNSGSYFNASFTERQLILAEHDADENVTVTAQFYNNSSTSTIDHEITFHIHYENSTATERVNDSEVDNGDFVTVTDTNTTVVGIEILSTDETSIDSRTIGVKGSDTTVYVAFANSSAAEDWDDEVDAASSEEELSNIGLNAAAVKVSSSDTTKWVPVYAEEAPDSVSDSDTYAVITEVDGTRTLKVHLGDDFEDASEVDITAHSDPGILTVVQAYGTDSIPLDMTGFVATGAIVPLAAAGSRRQEA